MTTRTLTSATPPASTLDPLIDWIDRELVNAYGIESGRGGNTLLQLRRMFIGRHLNAAVGGFYRLLPRLERHHFLLGYRIRRWISLNFEVLLSDPLQRVPGERIEIQETDRNLMAHRERFSGDADKNIEKHELRVQVLEKSAVTR